MVTKANVPNYLVVAIDTQLRDDLTAKGYNVYYKDISVSGAMQSDYTAQHYVHSVYKLA